ncbi:MAG: DUF2284 domain-containing protein [Ruminococcaceae bacterium]|nr:DUF2284 domain-containing protein [Oscillospiraceae bacterium]
MEYTKKIHELIEEIMDLGATRAALISAKEVKTDRRFRDICASNACGMYGNCWTCPPDAGDIDELMASLENYTSAIVYQTVGELEDSFDFEGMQEAGEKHNLLVRAVRKLFDSKEIGVGLHLGAGGCRICTVCAKRTNEPCRYPDLALSSLETYGINVSQLAETAGMKYINGSNTVTYFGAVFF